MIQTIIQIRLWICYVYLALRIGNICVMQDFVPYGWYELVKVVHFYRKHTVKPPHATTPYLCSHIYQAIIRIRITFSCPVSENCIWMEPLLRNTQRKQAVLFIGKVVRVQHTELYSASTGGSYFIIRTA